MLTDKTLCHFENWAYLNDYRFSLRLKRSFKIVAIIEWMESEGFLIEIGVDQTTVPKYDYKLIRYEHFGNYEKLASDGLFRSREEASVEAIMKFDRIYNNKANKIFNLK